MIPQKNKESPQTTILSEMALFQVLNSIMGSLSSVIPQIDHIS